MIPRALDPRLATRERSGATSLRRVPRRGKVATIAFVLALAWARLAHADPATAAGVTLPLLPRAHARRFALVIGSNHTLDRRQAPLRYADDDAAKLAEVLREAEVDVELLATLDRDSQAIWADQVGVAHPARRRMLEARWAALRARMQAAKDRGSKVEFILFYSGHGDVGPDGQGYLTLDDGKFTRSDLFGKLLASSPADHNHVLLDACQSEQFVLTRGKRRWKSDDATTGYDEDVRRYLERHQLAAFPNTGVLLAHSVDQQTHEWEHYRGGIFTHELVSGLRGGADLNGDGQLEYSEIGAFVSAANRAVTDPRARLQVVVRPPADDERRPLLVHPALVATRVLFITGDVPDLYTVEDRRGIRVADIRRSGDRPAYVRLPPGDMFITREHDAGGEAIREEVEISADRAGMVLSSTLTFAPGQQRARGSLDAAFRAGLFTTPFGRGYYDGYTDRTGLLPLRNLQWHADVWKDATRERPVAEEAAPPATASPTTKVTAQPPPRPPAKKQKTPSWQPGDTWGGISVGVIVTPFAPRGVIRGSAPPSRVTSDSFSGGLSRAHPSRNPALRGIDLRWQVFNVSRDKKYPRVLGYFRSSYTAGAARFDDTDATPAGQATSLSYFTVPLFLGGNFYLFPRFPLRPFAGLGFGLDVLRVSYARASSRGSNDVSARVGFELHAGLEVRVLNYVALSGEVMQLWSARRKLTGLPDFSNTGFTVITGVSVAWPFWQQRERPRGGDSPTAGVPPRKRPSQAAPVKDSPADRPVVSPQPTQPSSAEPTTSPAPSPAQVPSEAAPPAVSTDPPVTSPPS